LDSSNTTNLIYKEVSDIIHLGRHKLVYSNKERAMALARANKFKPLFNSGHFDDIVDAIQVPDDPAGTRRAAFDTAVASINWLTPSEKDWLYNYLQHCEDVWNNPNIPDGVVAASTGW
jgi:hypothetical protein